MSFDKLLEQVEKDARHWAARDIERIEQASVLLFNGDKIGSLFGTSMISARYSDEDKEAYMAGKAREAKDRLMSGLLRMAFHRDDGFYTRGIDPETARCLGNGFLFHGDLMRAFTAKGIILTLLRGCPDRASRIRRIADKTNPAITQGNT